MKKFTLFLSLCLMFIVGSMNAFAEATKQYKIVEVNSTKVATLEALVDGTYLMKNFGRGLFVYEQTNHELHGTKKVGDLASLAGSVGDNKVVTVKKASSGKYVFSFVSGFYLSEFKESGKVLLTEQTETPAEFVVEKIGTGDGLFSIKTPDADLWLNGNDGEGAIIVAYTSASGVNSHYEFYPVTVEEVSAVEVTLTYNMVINGETREVAKTVVTKPLGGKVSAQDALPAFTKATDETETEVTATTTALTYVVEEVLPFKTSESFENANWQGVLMHTNQTNFWQYNDGGTVTVVPSNGGQDSQLWAFVGNLLDGFKIYNKAAGATYTLNKPGNGGVVTGMSTEDSNNIFMISESDVNGSCCFKLKGDNTLLNAQDGQIKTWEYPDAGSSYRFYSPASFAMTAVNAYILPETIADRATSIVNYPSNLAKNYSSFKAAYDAVKDSEYDVEAARELVGWTEYLEEGIAFNPKMKYHLFNLGRSNTLGTRKEVAETTEAWGVAYADSILWQFVQVGETETYKMLNLSTNMYVGPISDDKGAQVVNTAMTDEAGAAIFTLEEINNVQFQFKDNNDRYMHIAAGNNIVNWQNGDASNWYLFEIDPITVAAVSPEAGEVAELPTTVTVTFSDDIASVGYASLQTVAGKGAAPADITSQAVVSGNTVTVTLTAEQIADAALALIRIQAVDAYGRYITYGDFEGYVVLEYTKAEPVVANLFEIVSITPATENPVAALDTLVIKFNDPTSRFGTTVGGFDESKQVVLKDANDAVVANGILDFGEGWDEVVVDLDNKIASNGTYTLVLPEGTVYNGMFNPDDSDFGVSFGAIYNAERTFTFTIDTTVGINAVTADAAKAAIYDLSGRKVNAMVKGGIYIRNGKKFVK